MSVICKSYSGIYTPCPVCYLPIFDNFGDIVLKFWIVPHTPTKSPNLKTLT